MRKIAIKKNNEFSILYQRSSIEKKVFAVIFVIFFLYAASLVYPFIWLFINSFMDSAEYSINISAGKPFALPTKWTFYNYKYAFSNMEYEGTTFIGMIFNSIWYSMVVSITGVFISSITGYCISKYKFKASRIIYAVAIFSLTLPVIGTTAAMYKLLHDLRIYDTPLYVLVTNLGGFGFNFLVMYGFFKNISWSYAEAVFIDGGGHYTVFFKIMLPIARAPIFTLFIMAVIASWNDYLSVILYLPSFPTIASGIYNIGISLLRTGKDTIYYSALIVSIIPILILFAAFSELIMSNLTMGGLKG